MHLLSKFGGSSLNAWWVVARTSSGLTDTHTDGHTHTHRQTQATTIPEGQNWPRVKMIPCLHKKTHSGSKMILRLSYLHNGIFYTGKTTFKLIWTNEDIFIKMLPYQYRDFHYKDKSFMIIFMMKIPNHGKTGFITNVSRALQNNLAKIYNARNHI